MSVTKAQVAASLNALRALADAILVLGEVPSGQLYSTVMGHMDLQTYESFINRLIRTGLVEKKHDLLIWKGERSV